MCSSLTQALLHLFQAGAQIADPVIDTFNGQEVEVWPRITWIPRWGLIFKDVKAKVHSNSSVSQRSALVINGKNITIQGLSLDGTLIVNAKDEAKVIKIQTHSNYQLVNDMNTENANNLVIFD